MVAARSIYAILGLHESATTEEIRRAYRARVKKTHPDRNANDPEAHEQFLMLKAAYEILIHPQRRAAYDRYPDGALERQISEERSAQRLRRRRRLKRLYD
jgi:molecular chaperone DnaJ